jgi:hypothetical protein
MVRNRDLKGIAQGLVETFISRNNDVSGFWGIGMLYREALEHSASRVDLDILSGQSQPEGPTAQAVLSRYSAYLFSRLDGLQILKAQITLEFGTFGLCQAPRYFSYGDPFVCTVLLTSASGRTYTSCRTGRCAPHSSDESRSTRAGSNNSFKPKPLRGSA